MSDPVAVLNSLLSYVFERGLNLKDQTAADKLKDEINAFLNEYQVAPVAKVYEVHGLDIPPQSYTVKMDKIPAGSLKHDIVINDFANKFMLKTPEHYREEIGQINMYLYVHNVPHALVPFGDANHLWTEVVRH
jgi:hypothetical protein